MDSLKGFRDPERAYGQHFENHRTTKRTLTGEGKKSDHTRSSTLHYIHGASPVVQRVKCLPAMQETQVQSLGWEDPLEKAMATHSSTLAWKIPWRSLVGYSPWGHKELDTTERLYTCHLKINIEIMHFFILICSICLHTMCRDVSIYTVYT